MAHGVKLAGDFGLYTVNTLEPKPPNSEKDTVVCCSDP